jgi:hypothetical protein
MERSNDGYLVTTRLPDNSVVESYRERQELEGYNKTELNTIHLFRSFDLSVVKVKQSGEVVIISSNQRNYLNSIGMNLEMPRDKDYFFEIFGTSQERRSGVYSVDLKFGKLWTHDEEGNTFIVYANGESVERMAVSFDLDQNAETLLLKRPASPRNQKDGEHIEEECKFLPPPKTVRAPRLINIREDGTAEEFFNEKQLEYFFRLKRLDPRTKTIQKTVQVGQESVKLHQFLTLTASSYSPPKTESLIAKEVVIPRLVKPIAQTTIISDHPREEIHTKVVMKFPEIKEDQFLNTLQRFRDFKDFEKDQDEKLTVRDPRTEEEIHMEHQMYFTLIKQKGIKAKHMSAFESKIWAQRKTFEGYNQETDEDEDLFSDTEDESPEQEQEGFMVDDSRDQESFQIMS